MTPADGTNSTLPGADAHSILGHTFHVDQAFVQEQGNAFGEQAVQDVPVPGAECRQAVVIDGHAATDPLKRDLSFVPAAPVQFTSTANRPQGGIQPERHQDPYVDRLRSRRALDRLIIRDDR